MSRIPDCRTDEYYNQKYVKGDDEQFLCGFDWATEMAVDNFFDNEMAGLQDENEYLGHVLCEDIPKSMREKYEMEFAFGDREDEEREVKTYADLIRMRLLEWIEATRNELIASMLDNLSEEDYERIKAEVDGRSEEENR